MPFRRALTRRRNSALTEEEEDALAPEDPKPPQRPPEPAKRHAARARRYPWWVRLLLWTSALLLLAMAGAVLVFELVFGSLARNYDLQALQRLPERSLVLDRLGGTIGKLHGQNRKPVPYDQISPYFLDALLAREDERFLDHHGVDFTGVLRAMLRNVTERQRAEGASTISMQLARNVFQLGRQKSYYRKLLEIAIARRIESHFTKPEILTFYCNQVYLGQALYGVESGAQAYFGKRAAEITPGEAAMLAGIIRGPNALSPWKNVHLAHEARNTVLDRMVDTGRLDLGVAGIAKAQPTQIQPEPKSITRDPYLVDVIRRQLDELLDAEAIQAGGLRIHTTVDPGLQTEAEASMERRLTEIENTPGYTHRTRSEYHAAWASGKLTATQTPDYVQGAVLLLENNTGAIRAMVGGRDQRHSSYDRANTAQRQAGSTIKPLVYAAAAYVGLFPGLTVSDNAIDPAELRPLDKRFSPENADLVYAGLQPAHFGLAKSRNTMTVRVGERAGIHRVQELLMQSGLDGPHTDSAQLFLGNTGVTLRGITSALSIFANNGARCRPYLIDRIEDAQGEAVFRSGILEYEVVKPGAAWTVNQMMQKVTQPGGTGEDANELGLKAPLCGKTGTTDGYKDAWFVGSTPFLTCGVWIGLDANLPIIPRGYGSKLALPLWGDVMKRAQREGYIKTSEHFPETTTEERRICQISGAAAHSGCPSVTVNLPSDSQPDGACGVHRPTPKVIPPPAPAADPFGPPFPPR